MRTLALATFVFLANSAMAEPWYENEILDRVYVGGGVNFVSADVANADDQNYTTVELVGGYKYNGFLGGEIRAGLGLTKEESSNELGVTEETTLPYHVSAYWRPETVNEVAKIYGLVGFTALAISFDNGTSSDTNSEVGASYGGGVGFVFDEVWNLNFEYRVLLDKESTDFSSVSANVDYRF